MRRFLASQFNWSRQHRSLATEASDIGFSGSRENIQVRSPKTNVVAEFEFKDTVLSDDEDCELIEWQFIPTAATVRSNPQLTGFVLHIFND